MSKECFLEAARAFLRNNEFGISVRKFSKMFGVKPESVIAWVRGSDDFVRTSSGSVVLRDNLTDEQIRVWCE